MTPQEALENLKNILDYEVDYNPYKLALNMAINALEKQIPKKPNGIYDENKCEKDKKEFYYEQVLIGQCPSCNQEVQEGMKFCMDCGQAIDWSE